MKKKYYILIGLITCMFMFLPVSSIKAEEITLCEYYSAEVGTKRVSINYDNKSESIYFSYYWEQNGLEFALGINKLDGSMSKGNDNLYISGTSSKEYAYKKIFIENRCPQRVFFDYKNVPIGFLGLGGIETKAILCFDDTTGYVVGDSYCAHDKGFDLKYYMPLKYEGIDTAYKTLLTNFKVDLDSKISTFYNQESTYYETKGELNKSGRGVCNSLISKPEGQREVAFINDTIYPIIEGIFDRNISNKFPNTISEKYKEEKKDELIKKAKENQSVKNMLNDCYKMIDAKVENNEMTQQEGEQLKESLTTEKLYDSEHFDKLLDDLFPDVYIEKDDIYKGKYYCGIFGEGSFEIVKDLFGIVKMLIPAIIILLGMADFLKVVFSGEEKDMKSAGMRLVKRLIIGIIFILLPVLLGFIFDIVGFSETCLGQLI